AGAGKLSGPLGNDHARDHVAPARSGYTGPEPRHDALRDGGRFRRHVRQLLLPADKRHTGTMLHVSGSCTQGSTSYPVTFTGTIDPETGTASVSGDIPGLLGEMHCSSAGDGEETHTTCTSITPACNVSFVGTKCGNGIVDE